MIKKILFFKKSFGFKKVKIRIKNEKKYKKKNSPKILYIILIAK
jgi:hypothetical protein